MRRLGLLLLLAACGRGTAPPPPEAGYRDRTVPIGTPVNLDTDRLAGTWRDVARFPAAVQRACTDPVQRIGGTLEILCAGEAAPRFAAPLVAAGPGRFSTGIEPLPDWWVLWVDEGYRTLVVGTPDGRAGWILDRADAAPDRLSAAREILDFNGYDLSRLED